MFLVCTVQHMDSKLGLCCVQFSNPLHSLSIALYSRFQYQYEYNSCGKKFTLQHAMNCKFGGIIHHCHDKIKHDLMNIAAMATRESAVGAEPLIKPGSFTALCSNNSDSNNDTVSSEDCGNNIVQSLWGNLPT